MPVQASSQTFRDGFSMAGLSQVFIVETLYVLLFVYLVILDYECLLNLQDFLGDDFKSQGSHVPYNVTDFSTQVYFKEVLELLCTQTYVLYIDNGCVGMYLMLETNLKLQGSHLILLM